MSKRKRPEDLRSHRWLGANDLRAFGHRSRLRQDKGHQAEWQAFSAAIRSGGPPPIPYDQLFGVARAVIAAVEALRNGERIEITP